MYSVHHSQAYHSKQVSHVDFFLNRLMSITKNLTASRQSFTDMDRNIQNLENIIFLYDDKREAVDKIMPCLGKNFLAVLNKAYLAWEAGLESKFIASALINNDLTILDYKLFRRFATLISNEAAFLSRYRNKYENILFIGSGSLPISAILLHEIFDAPVDCLATDQTAYENSLRLIKKWRLAQINVYKHPIEEHELAKYDAVFVALRAKPKYQILDALYENTRADCKVICRTAYELRTILYEPTHPLYLGKYQMMENYTAKGMNNVISSVLLSK